MENSCSSELEGWRGETSGDRPMDMGGNPFKALGQRNLRQHEYGLLNKKWIQDSVESTFDEWDPILRSRLKQLCEAVMPPTRHKPFRKFLRMLCLNDWIWLCLARKAKYRIVRLRKAGCWAVELHRPKAYYSYGDKYFVKVSFSLDEKSNPSGFHLCRGSDNKSFDTAVLDADLLTRSLLCHFGRLHCGNDQEEDLQHLADLKGARLISSHDFYVEKQNLLTNKVNSKLYVLPPRSARSSNCREARLRLLFTLFCSLLLGAILLYAKKFGRLEHSGGPKPGAAMLGW